MDVPDDDRIRAAYEAFNTHRSFDTALFSPDVEWHNAPQWPGASVHHGIEAIRRDIERQQEAWGEATYDPIEIRRAGDRIVVMLEVVLTGKTSGVPTGMEGAHVLTVRDGMVVRVQAFIHREDALAAAGLA